MRRQKNNVFLVERRLDIVWFLFAWSLAFLAIGVVYRTKLAPEEEVLAVGFKKEVESLKTPLHDGDMEKTLWLDWIPQVQTLATGTVDEVTWGFEDAPFYVEALDEWKAGWYMNCLLTCNTLTGLSSHRAITGVYNIRRLGYTTETREVSDANGGTRYRCAVTGMFVKSWRSPYRKACSREQALEYYNKCSAQIDSAVAQVVAARSSDGKPLSDVEKLKWVHDWLIKNADYAYDEAERASIYSEAARHLCSEYGALVDGEAVCKGYAYAFKAIVDELAKRTGADIECEEATSRTHSWARVKIDKEWYNVDVTWDENNSSPEYEYVSGKYFLVSDEEINDGAHQDYSSVSSTKATSKKYEGRDWGESLV